MPGITRSIDGSDRHALLTHTDKGLQPMKQRKQLSLSSIRFLRALRDHDHFTQYDENNPERGLFTMKGVNYLNTSVQPHGFRQAHADQCIHEITEFFRR